MPLPLCVFLLMMCFCHDSFTKNATPAPISLVFAFAQKPVYWLRSFLSNNKYFVVLSACSFVSWHAIISKFPISTPHLATALKNPYSLAPCTLMDAMRRYPLVFVVSVIIDG